MRTVAIKKGDKYIMVWKTFITNGVYGDYYVVTAKQVRVGNKANKHIF
jgi:hypothetical protein